jgi:uncharacterized protein YndB with AHSA1/START domain
MEDYLSIIFQKSLAIEPSERAVLRWARTSRFRMPTRDRETNEVRWVPLGNVRLGAMLHNPVYAGVYVFGRHAQTTVLVDGEIRTVRKRRAEPAEWPVRIDNAHPAYITWETYMKNRDKLRENRSRPRDASRGAPREGAVLLGGLVLCGRCGRRMSTRYASRSASWSYTCWGESSHGNVTCWSVAGAAIDRAVERLFLQAMIPSEIDLSLAVEREVQHHAGSLDKAWRARIEQARYDARHAERRYKAVDPDNRVVARTLEGEWEQRLCELEAVEQDYAEARRIARVELTARDRERIREIARDLPAVWAAPTTSAADRKAMLRLVIEAVAIHPVDVPRRSTRIVVQWTSGTVDELTIPRPHKGAYRAHSPEAIERIRELAATGLRDDQIANRLASDGVRTGAGLDWREDHVRQARRAHGIARVAPDRPRMLPLPHRHPEHGWFSITGAMAHFGVCESTARRWITDGVVRALRADYATHRNVYWLKIDGVTAAKLARSRRARG